MLRVMHLLVHVGGDAPVAAELGQMVLDRYPDAEAATWYNVACSLSRSGHVDRALQVLSGAIDRGWNQLDQLDRDPDLAAARAHPRSRASATASAPVPPDSRRSAAPPGPPSARSGRSGHRITADR